MFFQRIFARVDRILSSLFWLEAWGHGDKNREYRWEYFIDIGKTIGVVGLDGKIHTMMGYWSVRHYYENGKLVKRIPVRKDLGGGERLATNEEIALHQAELRRQHAQRHGVNCF